MGALFDSALRMMVMDTLVPIKKGPTSEEKTCKKERTSCYSSVDMWKKATGSVAFSFHIHDPRQVYS